MPNESVDVPGERAIDVPDLSSREVRASARVTDAGVAVTLSGSAEHESAEALIAYVERVHAAAQRLRATEVEIDLRDLVFMVSSCLKAFIVWISRVEEMPVEARYRIVFLSSKQHGWQRRSLRAVTCFAPDLIRVEELAPSSKRT